MVSGKVRCGFFQELIFHLQFPGFPFEPDRARSFTVKRRFLAGMFTAVDANPVTEGAFVNTELLRHAGDRT